MKTKYIKPFSNDKGIMDPRSQKRSRNSIISNSEMYLNRFRPSSHKGGFFSESAICFSDLQISKKYIPKNYPELEI